MEREKKKEYLVRKMEGKKTLWGHNNFLGIGSSLFRNLFIYLFYDSDFISCI